MRQERHYPHDEADGRFLGRTHSSLEGAYTGPADKDPFSSLNTLLIPATMTPGISRGEAI